MGGMPLPRKDPFIREKYTRERSAARKLAAEYFQKFPKDRYRTEVETWRHLQSANIEFTMKRLREPIDDAIMVAAKPRSCLIVLFSKLEGTQ
jgi:hypothetical protein